MRNKFILLLFLVSVLEIPNTVHGYQYVGNDPINKVDPLGLKLYGIGGSAGATLFLGGELNLHLSYDTDTGKFGVVFTPNFRIGPLIGASANVSVIVADNGGKSNCPPAKIDDLKGKSSGVAADFGPIGSIIDPRINNGYNINNNKGGLILSNRIAEACSTEQWTTECLGLDFQVHRDYWDMCWPSVVCCGSKHIRLD